MCVCSFVSRRIIPDLLREFGTEVPCIPDIDMCLHVFHFETSLLVYQAFILVCVCVCVVKCLVTRVWEA